MRRILVIRIDLLGDVVLSMPAVEALRAAYPTAHIAMLVLPFTRSIPEASAAVDEVITLDTNRSAPGQPTGVSAGATVTASGPACYAIYARASLIYASACAA